MTSFYQGLARFGGHLENRAGEALGTRLIAYVTGKFCRVSFLSIINNTSKLQNAISLLKNI